MSSSIYEEALADVKKLKEVAEQNAKNAIIDAVTPKIREMIEKQLIGDDSVDEGDVLNDLAESLFDEDAEDVQLTSESLKALSGLVNSGGPSSVKDAELNSLLVQERLLIIMDETGVNAPDINSLVEMKNDNFRPTILRLGTVFGPSPRPRFDLVVNLLTAKAVRDGKITIFGGDQWRPNVHVEDVAETIISVLEAPLDKVGGEVFNVGSEKNNHTINELGNFVKGKVPSAELIIEEKDVDKRDYKVDFTKLREGLELSLERTVDEGISGIISFLEDNKDINYEDSKYSNVKFLEQGKLTEFFSNGDTKT